VLPNAFKPQLFPQYQTGSLRRARQHLRLMSARLPCRSRFSQTRGSRRQTGAENLHARELVWIASGNQGESSRFLSSYPETSSDSAPLALAIIEMPHTRESGDMLAKFKAGTLEVIEALAFIRAGQSARSESNSSGFGSGGK